MREVELRNLTTLGVGGKARVFIAETRHELAKTDGLVVLGGGSNILAGNRALPDFVLNKTSGRNISEEGIYADSGERLSKLCMFATVSRLHGLEWAWGMPGTLGGAIYGNAGACGHSISDIIEYVDVAKDGKTFRLAKDECGFGYRGSDLDLFGVILGAKLRLKSASPYEIEMAAEEAKKRRALQPKGKSAGCIFKNKDGISAGKIIDSCGLKNKRIGGAKISDKHANFIINDANARSEDVYRLILYVEEQVKKQTGIVLEREIKIFGEF